MNGLSWLEKLCVGVSYLIVPGLPIFAVALAVYVLPWWLVASVFGIIILIMMAGAGMDIRYP